MTLSVRPPHHFGIGAGAHPVAVSISSVGERLHRWSATRVGQILVLVVAAGMYFGVRHLTVADAAAADRHAGWVRSFERSVHLNQEGWIQRRALPHPWMIDIADDIYIYGHWPFIIAALSWLLINHREHFVIARNALLMSGAVALVVFALFPVAPPRLAEQRAIVDTVTVHTDAYRVLQPTAFTDAYAAMPSLHCGWDLLVALTLAHAVSRRWLKGVIMVVPVLMAASVLITGNHYVVDVLAGDTLAGSAWCLARSTAARRRLATEQPAAVSAWTSAERRTA